MVDSSDGAAAKPAFPRSDPCRDVNQEVILDTLDVLWALARLDEDADAAAVLVADVAAEAYRSALRHRVVVEPHDLVLDLLRRRRAPWAAHGTRAERVSGDAR